MVHFSLSLSLYIKEEDKPEQKEPLKPRNLTLLFQSQHNRERREKEASFEVMAGLNDDVSVDIEEISNGGKVLFLTHTHIQLRNLLSLFVFFPLSFSYVSFYGKLDSSHFIFSLLWVHSFPN